MNKYSAFITMQGEDLLAEDLKAGRYFIIQEGRKAVYDERALIFDNGDRIPVRRVWQGDWPNKTFSLTRVMASIDRKVQNANKR